MCLWPWKLAVDFWNSSSALVWLWLQGKLHLRSKSQFHDNSDLRTVDTRFRWLKVAADQSSLNILHWMLFCLKQTSLGLSVVRQKVVLRRFYDATWFFAPARSWERSLKLRRWRRHRLWSRFSVRRFRSELIIIGRNDKFLQQWSPRLSSDCCQLINFFFPKTFLWHHFFASVFLVAVVRSWSRTNFIGEFYFLLVIWIFFRILSIEVLLTNLQQLHFKSKLNATFETFFVKSWQLFEHFRAG